MTGGPGDRGGHGGTGDGRRGVPQFITEAGDQDVPDVIPAATVILLRDGAGGLETLMLRRNSKLEFAGGMWVFPGGRVDDDDYDDDEPADVDRAARNAAAREAVEEAGLAVPAEAMVPFSHWTPPPISIKRFATWFFVASAPDGTVVIDDGEIHDHSWAAPAEVMARRDAGEIELAPPTWVSLHRLARLASVESALEDAAREPVEFFETHIASGDAGVAALWQGDAGYDDSDVDRPGDRHRLWMAESGWRYERTDRR